MLDQCQKMTIRSLIGSMLGLVLMTGSPHAHFIWSVIERSDDGNPEARFYFSETASPDSAEFLDRLTRMQAWHRTPEGKYTPLKLQKVERDDSGLLAGALTSGRGSIEAECLYGTFSHSDQTMLLRYYSKSLSSDASDRLRRSRKLDPDVSPRLADRELQVSVFWRGVPDDSGTSAVAGTSGSPRLTDLPRGITSFGAAVIGDWMYVYGGHFGRAHHYSNTSQSNQLSRLNLRNPGDWEVVAQGPRLQGLAMVTHSGKLYRAGGFTAHNNEGDEHDLRSIADVVRFHPETGQWESLPDLPEPRSSHDAVVIGNELYVVGGWRLGGEKPAWHETAWMADLSKDDLAWIQLPRPPFKRRALSLGHLDNKLCVIGGMQPKGGPTTRVDVFDPGSGTWSQGPSMIDTLADADRGKGMEGFGASAYTLGGRLIVSTYNGNVQVLKPGDGEWTIAAQLQDDRFFHRMLPHDGRLLLVGGASMRSGKRLHFETVELSSLK
ncbi:MAG: hypothetical protein OXH11_16355 [Candidatus Aminicenantes bacterium]|nr:hypothetical protein [Candidatus Aminicenantes bacterium]